MKCYCLDCVHLELRPIYAEEGFFTGKYVLVGTRFRCAKNDEYFPYGFLDEYMEYKFCLYGEKGKPHAYLDKVEETLEQAKKYQCLRCPDTTNCVNCNGIKIINKISQQAIALKELNDRKEGKDG